MVKISMKGINVVRKTLSDSSVATYYYHRSTKKRLAGKPGSVEFFRSYQDAEAVKPHNGGTVSELIRTYSLSKSFSDKAASTQREYKRMMVHLERQFGDMPLRLLESPKIRRVFVEYHERIGRDRPREADNRLVMLSTVFSHALDGGRIGRNPLKDLNRMHKSNRSNIIWREGDVDAFMEGAPIELQRAMILAIHTGQRYGDLVRLRWDSYDGASIELRQRKTGQKLKIKCPPALKRMLDDAPRNGECILCRSDGRPWYTGKDDKALGKAWTDRMKVAGLYHKDPSVRLRFHDLRGSAVTYLAEGGATHIQIAAVTGHTFRSVNDILEKYTARTESLASQAIDAYAHAKTGAFANRLQTSA